MVSSISAANSYGNIQRVSVGADNRVIYRVTDSEGKYAGAISIAQNDVDKFEKSYSDIMETAPKIQEFVANHSKPEDLQRRKNTSRLLVAAGGIVGAVTPFLLLKNAGTTKKIVSTIVGIVAGLSAGFGISLYSATPPGAYKFARAAKNLSKIDIQNAEIPLEVRATRM